MTFFGNLKYQICPTIYPKTMVLFMLISIKTFRDNVFFIFDQKKQFFTRK